MFIDILGKVFANAGHFRGTSIHVMKRQLGKKVDEGYTQVERCQDLTQAESSRLLPKLVGQDFIC